MKNTRLHQAVYALATGEEACRDRCVVAMRILEGMHPSELDNHPHLKTRLNRLKADLGKKGSHKIGEMFFDKYENTAAGRRNATYVKYAEELFSIWWELENSDE